MRPNVGLLKKSLYLAAAFGVTKFITGIALHLATLSCGA
jgi:hypothetical protein